MWLNFFTYRKSILDGNFNFDIDTSSKGKNVTLKNVSLFSFE